MICSGTHLGRARGRNAGSVTPLRKMSSVKSLPCRNDDAIPLLRTGELRGTAVGSLDERAHLIVDGSSTLPFPLGCFVPGRDVARFRLTG